MGHQLTNPDSASFNRYCWELFDEFGNYNDGDLWTKLAADTNATVGHEGDGSRSRVKLYTGDAIKNNECCFATTNEQFKFVAGKEIVVEGRIQYAEVATDDARVAFGLGDAMGANLITDAAAGSQAIAVKDGALIWKQENDTQWRFHTEINNVSTATQSTTVCTGGGVQTLRIECKPISSTVFECRPFVDGAQLRDSSGTPIMHVVTLGTADDMDFGVYLKSGANTSGTETLYVDYMYGKMAR
jgi:hypothetical protein